MNLKQLEAFVCVAEVKSFSKAARKLYLTQPTISAHINALEKELKNRLFTRTTKDVILSPAGGLLYENAKKMLQLEQQIRQDFAMFNEEEHRKIVVGVSTVPGQYILPRVLPLFCKSYPQNQIWMMESDSEGVIRMVSQGEAEIGFAGNDTEDPNCVCEPFWDDELVIVTPNTEAYSRFLEVGFPLEQLYEEPVLIREAGSGTRQTMEKYLVQEGIEIERLRVVASMSNQETIKKSVSNGMGVSIMSAAAVHDYVEQGKLLQFPMKDGGICRKLYMVWNRNNKPGMAARTFIQFVRELYEYL